MFLVMLAIAPGIFWLWYFLSKDRLRPEPRHLVIRVFLLGFVAAVAASLLEWSVFRAAGIMPGGSGPANVLAAAAVIGLIEEGTKFLAVYAGVYRHAAFDEVLDGIVYAVAAALGFATMENVQYVLQGGAEVGVIRAVLAVPGHAFCGALMGFNMGMAKFAGPRERAWLLSGFGLAALAHAAYDALLLSRTVLALAAIPLIIILWRRAIGLTRRAQAEDDRRQGPGAA